MSSKRTARAIVAVASTGIVGGLLGGVVTPAHASPSYPNSEPVVGGSVLISEIANGGPGATSNASRVSADDFMEIANFSSDPIDISHYRILRCGQTGDVYGPQKVVPPGTILAPGEQYTVGSPTSTNKGVVKRDADYDDTGSTLHEFGFGAMLEAPNGDVLDRVGFYHPSVLSECGMTDRSLARPLDHRLGQSHQRIATTGDAAVDFAVARRTPDAPNATTPAPTEQVQTPIRITEVANESATSTADQFVELTNTGSTAVDVTGWKLYRCGENGTTYVQNQNLSGSIAPGASYVVAHASGRYAAGAQATYATGMHWRDYGAMVTTGQDQIVDRMGSYANRNSMCTDGTPSDVDVNNLENESYHRVGDTGNNEADFAIATERTPGVASRREDLAVAPRGEHSFGPVRISEIAGAGPEGSNDEFLELANYGDAPVNLAGWSVVRCEGTGRGNAGTQIADLGNITLHPGQTWLGTDNGAPPALLAQADGVWTTGVADTTYGFYVRDAQGAMVDAAGVYETVTYSPCVVGSEIRGYAKTDQGEAYHRARATGDAEEDFVAAERSPGVLSDVKYRDPTEPMPGELDRVDLATNTAPGTPQTSGKAAAGRYTAQVKVVDADGGDLDLQVHSTTPLDAAQVDAAGARVYGGATARKVPANLTVAGERRLRAATLSARADGHNYPYLRFAIPAAQVPAEGVEFTLSTRTRERNDVQVYVWHGEKWTLLEHATADADGNLTVRAALTAAHAVDGYLNVLVIDGPRAEGGMVEEIGVTDRAFADPALYDWAMNHMTDTQFLSEGFREAFRKMSSWVVANEEDRKIGYSTNTGDIIENWIGGNADPKRARKEFAAAKKIMDRLNTAGVPNGVLPGNHDNFWGRDNTLYNEYFGPQMYQDEEWYGSSWRQGDNSAHYDFVTEAGVDYLMISLPYRPTKAQRTWAREIAAMYPQHNVVLLTHSYLNTQGKVEDLADRVTARGHLVWSEVVAPSDNIFLVLGGHYHGVATKYGDPVTGEQSDAIDLAGDTIAVRNVGESGRMVVQMLADYQGYRSTQPAPRADTLDRDSAFQRLLQFDVDAELMGVNAYSPHLDSFEAYKYDEPGMRGTAANDFLDGRYGPSDDEFVAKIDLLVPKQLAAVDWGVSGAASLVSTRTVEAGSTVPVDLGTPVAGQRWYAVVSDGHASASSVPVTVSMDEAPDAASRVDLTSTRTSQVEGAAAAQDRALLSAEVTAAAGEVTGAVEFVSGATVLASVPVVDGEAEHRLAADLAVGVHTIEARFVPTPGSGVAASVSASVSVEVLAAEEPPVVKETSVATATLAKTTVRRGERARLRVVVSSTANPTGKVKVVVTSKGRVRTVSATLVGGRAIIKLPRLAKGAWRVATTYLGSATVSGDRAPTVRLTVL